MVRTLVQETSQKITKKVILKGWVSNRRDHGKIIFIDLRDRTGIVQLVCNNKAGSLKPGYVVEIEGIVSKRPKKMVNPDLETGKLEIQVEEIKILARAEELPFDMGGPELKVELPTLLDYRSLTLRHPKVLAVFKIQEIILQIFRSFLKGKGFTEISVPTIVATATEGGSEVFPIEYFDKKAYLAQSPQFYKQIMVGVFDRVFTVNKTLRAEPSVTTRHLAEVTTLDAEFGFIDSWTELIEMVEYVTKYVFSEIEKRNPDVLGLYHATLPKIVSPSPRLKLRDAQEIIFKRTGRDNRTDPDLQPEDEREICKWAREEKQSDLIFITHYPVKKRPFYTFEDPEDLGYTLSFDLLGRGMEWLTGGQRIHVLDELVRRAKERHMNIEKSELYLQAFRYGMPPEGGFSFGSERIVMSILGLGNIREASLFPRDMERVDIKL